MHRFPMTIEGPVALDYGSRYGARREGVEIGADLVSEAWPSIGHSMAHLPERGHWKRFNGPRIGPGHSRAMAAGEMAHTMALIHFCSISGIL